MNKWSPKIEIINYFDHLINRVDIDIDECLENYKKEDTIVDYITSNEKKTKLSLLEINSCLYQKEDISQKPTKVNDYLSQIREKTIADLRKAQTDSLENLGSINLTINNDLTDAKKLDDLRSQLYQNKFYFQILFKPIKLKWIFNLFTIVTDFYISQSNIELLEKIINADAHRKFKEELILDENLVLLELIHVMFYENLNSTNLPKHLFQVSKQDAFKIQLLYCSSRVELIGINLKCSTIDLSNLKKIVILDLRVSDQQEVKLENLTTLKYLKLNISSSEQFTFRNLTAVKVLELKLIYTPFDSTIQANVFDQLPSIQKLTLTGNFGNFNLDNLVHLNELSLNGRLDNDFNHDLFKNICNQLTKLWICCKNIYNWTIAEMFKSCQFSNLLVLGINSSEITRLQKRSLNGFPQLRELILDNNKLEIIEKDSLSDLKQLNSLLLANNSIDSLFEYQFIELTHLEFLDLRENKIKNVNSQSFFGLRNLKKLNLQFNKFKIFDLRILNILDQLEFLDISGNSIINREEIINRFLCYCKIYI